MQVTIVNLGVLLLLLCVNNIHAESSDIELDRKAVVLHQIDSLVRFYEKELT